MFMTGSVHPDSAPDLRTLVLRHIAATEGAEPSAARRAEAEYARHWWTSGYSPPSSLPDGLGGGFHDLRRNTAAALGLDSVARDAAMAWVMWASERGDGPSELRARARMVLDEAVRWARGGGEGAADEAEVPLLARIGDRLPGRSGDPRPATERAAPALIDATFRVVEAALLVGRPDLAEEPANWLRDQSEAPGAGVLSDDVTLLDARILRDSGEMAAAARLCAAAADDPHGDPVASRLKFRMELADYSIAAGQDETAARLLEEVAADAAEAGLPLQRLTAARAAIAVLLRLGEPARLRSLAAGALAGVTGMPDSPVIDEVRSAAGHVSA